MLVFKDQIGLILFLLLIVVSLNLFGQDENREKTKIDSLNFVIMHSVNDSIKVYNLVEISRLYSNDDIENSLTYSEKALEAAKESKDDNLRLYAVFNAGNACFYQGMFERASSYFYQYLEAQKLKTNKKGMAYAYSNIGAIYLKISDYSVAKANFMKALNILHSFNDNLEIKAQIPSIYNNLGIVYQNQKMTDSALWYYKNALKNHLVIEQEDLFRSAIYNNIGGLFLESGEFDSAFLSLSESMKIRQKINDLAGQATSHNKLGEYYLETGDLKKAKMHFYEGLQISLNIGSKDMQMVFTEKLYHFYIESKNADSALKYFVEFNQIREEINNSETLKELTRLELTSRFKEKEKLALLKQKKIQQTYFFVSLLLILILLLFVLLYILKNNRVKRLGLEKNNLLLNTENAHLEKENLEKELEIRNKELTTHVMGMIKKNETISHLVNILSDNLSRENEDLFQGIIRDLNHLQDDSVWEEFEMRYQQVHNQFYEKLQKTCPNLSTNERRLCAFLRLNMTTKDIASITGQSLRSIEVARTRLRKKLQITNSDISLIEYLNSF